jgi:transposase
MDRSETVKIAKSAWNRNLVDEKPIVVSCDVHTQNTYIFGVDTRSGEIKMEHNVFGGIQEVCRAVSKIGRKEDMIILYEAGCFGFSFYRKLTEAGYSCKIIAPNSIPRINGPKTDRDDAIRNFDYFCAGLLRFVWIPSKTAESARECLRYRYQLVWERTGEKQKVQAMLKRQGVIFTETKKPWSKKHYAWLKIVVLPAEVRIVLDMRRKKIERLNEDIDELDIKLRALMDGNANYRRLYEAYLKMTGIGPLGAVTWVLEGHDLNRFARPSNLMSYLGLVPKKNSSGGKDPALRITKAGNAYLRYVTICAARCYGDRRLTQKTEDIVKYPKPIGDLVKRSQDRLCNRYLHLRQNKKNGNKAKVAVARELCGFIWEMATIVLVQCEAEEMKKAA